MTGNGWKAMDEIGSGGGGATTLGGANHA